MSNFAVSFDGIDGRLVISDNNFDGLANGTIEFFIKKTIITEQFEKLLFKDGSIDIGLNNNGKLFCEIPGVGNLGIIGTDEDNGDTYHFAFSWDGSYLRGYKNGIYINKIAQNGNQNDNINPLYIGMRDTTEPYKGKIDEIRISDIARYTTETSFSIPSEKFSDDINTLLLLHLDEGSGETAYDSSGNGNDATFSGGVSWISPGVFNETSIAILKNSSIKLVSGHLYRLTFHLRSSISQNISITIKNSDATITSLNDTFDLKNENVWKIAKFEFTANITDQNSILSIIPELSFMSLYLDKFNLIDLTLNRKEYRIMRIQGSVLPGSFIQILTLREKTANET